MKIYTYVVLVMGLLTESVHAAEGQKASMTPGAYMRAYAQLLQEGKRLIRWFHSTYPQR